MPDSYWNKLVDAAKKAMETKLKWGAGFHGDDNHPNIAHELYEKATAQPEFKPEWLPKASVHDMAPEEIHRSQNLTLPQAIEVERDENPKIEITESEPPEDILKKIREYNARLRLAE